MYLYTASCRGVPLQSRLPISQRNVDAQGRICDSGFRTITAESLSQLKITARDYFKSIKMPAKEYKDILANLNVSVFDTTKSSDKILRDISISIKMKESLNPLPKIKFIRKQGRKTKRISS